MSFSVKPQNSDILIPVDVYKRQIQICGFHFIQSQIRCYDQRKHFTICLLYTSILKKREYLGHTINFKTRKHFKDKKSHYVSEDEWTIFENTHEAIIDQQTFDLVQKIRSNVRRYPNGWGEAAPLTGLSLIHISLR